MSVDRYGTQATKTPVERWTCSMCESRWWVDANSTTAQRCPFCFNPNGVWREHFGDLELVEV